jgi:hypothetical protein
MFTDMLAPMNSVYVFWESCAPAVAGMIAPHIAMAGRRCLAVIEIKGLRIFFRFALEG